LQERESQGLGCQKEKKRKIHLSPWLVARKKGRRREGSDAAAVRAEKDVIDPHPCCGGKGKKKASILKEKKRKEKKAGGRKERVRSTFSEKKEILPPFGGKGGMFILSVFVRSRGKGGEFVHSF